jgi:hypothetical protein
MSGKKVSERMKNWVEEDIIDMGTGTEMSIREWIEEVKALEASSDRIAEAVKKIATRILMFKNVRPTDKTPNDQLKKLELMECDTAIRQLEWALGILSASEGTKE